MRKGDKKIVLDLLAKAREILTGDGPCPDYCPKISTKPADQGCGYDAGCCLAADQLIQTAVEILTRTDS